MKAVFSGVQLGHKPKRYLSKGRLVHYPDQPERVRRLLAGARRAGAKIHASKSFDESVLASVHSARYLDFLKNGYAKWSVLEDAHEEMMPSVRPAPGPIGYSQHILGRAGWHLSDFSCPVVSDTWKVALASANTALTAAELVESGDRVAYALCRPPGHHAQHERAAGFCYLNNAALAAAWLRRTHDRVAIVDIDVHHGNGTQQIFYHHADILTVSIHADPNEFYPFYQGFESQKGTREGEGYNLNIVVPVKADDLTWLTALEEALARVTVFQPGALVVSLGLDTHEADPLAGGAVTTEGLAEMATMISSLKLPTVLVQEGGYLTPWLGDNLASFLDGFSR